MEDILDNFEEEKSPNRQIAKLFLLTGTGLTGGFVLLYYLRFYFFDSIFENKDFVLSANGFLLFAFIILAVRRFAVGFHAIAPKHKEVVIAILGGGMIFYANFLYKLLLNYLILQNGWHTDIWTTITYSLLISGLGATFTFSRIYSIREKKSWLPTALILAYFIIFHLIGNS